MKRIVLGLAVILVVILVVSRLMGNQGGGRLVAIKVGDESMSVATAVSGEELSLGLGERDSIGSDGMLFILPDRQVPRFWMKGMKFGLDIIWIDAGRIVFIHENIPAPPTGADTANLEIYSPPQPVTHVLELPAGEVQRRGIKVGEAMEILD